MLFNKNYNKLFLINVKYYWTVWYFKEPSVIFSNFFLFPCIHVNMLSNKISLWDNYVIDKMKAYLFCVWARQVLEQVLFANFSNSCINLSESSKSKLTFGICSFFLLLPFGLDFKFD